MQTFHFCPDPKCLHNKTAQIRSIEPPRVYYLDRELRKHLADHRRETVCFARNAPICCIDLWCIYIRRKQIMGLAMLVHEKASLCHSQSS